MQTKCFTSEIENKKCEYSQMKKTDKEIDIVRESEREQNEKKEIDGQTDRQKIERYNGWLPVSLDFRLDDRRHRARAVYDPYN